jgi:hypothetical protein
MKVKMGQPVEVMAPDSTNTVNAPVSFISSQVDPKTDSDRRAALRRDLTSTGPVLKPTRHRRAQGLSCHGQRLAIQRKTFIAVIEGEKATLKPVNAGLRDGDWGSGRRGSRTRQDGLTEGLTV